MLTVMFSSYNGADSLAITLNAFKQLLSPPGGWKLVIIDNASTDNSKRIIEGFKNALPITLLSETQQGKNAALNTGLSAIEGDLVVFTDDDIIPDPDWLIQLRNEADVQPEYSLFAGNIAPHWAIEPEDWLLRWVNHQIVYALTPINLASGEIPASMVWGPNMAVRSTVFEQGFRFDDKVGPDGTKHYKMGSETSFTGMLEKQGYKSFYAPQAKVKHIISQQEMDYSWIIGRAVRFGRGLFQGNLDPKKPAPPLVFGTPRYLIRHYIEGKLKLLSAHLSADKEKIFSAQWDLNETHGQIIEARAFYASAAQP